MYSCICFGYAARNICFRTGGDTYMNSWTDKNIKDLNLDDKMEMIEAFSNSLAEFYLASSSGDKKAVEFIARTLIETFSIIIMGEDVVEFESKISEIENNLNNSFKAEA